MMWVQFGVTIICSILASSGLWTWVQKRSDKNDMKVQMLIGLGHDRIVGLGLKYIERGWISYDEYENLYEYLYKPYEQLGGNGSAKRVMEAVNKLEIRKVPLPKPGSGLVNKLEIKGE